MSALSALVVPERACAILAAIKFSTILFTFSTSATFNFFCVFGSTNSPSKGLPKASLGCSIIVFSKLIPDSAELLIYKPFPSFFKKKRGVCSGDEEFKLQHIADGTSSFTTVTTQNLTNSSNAVLNGVAVGFDSSTQYIRGYMDEMCIWNRKINNVELVQVIADLKERHNMT